MSTSPRRRTRSRSTTALVTSLLAAACVLLTPDPADAGATPWRFNAASGQILTVPASSVAAKEVTCTAGYIAVSGGISVAGTDNFERFSEYRTPGGGYSVAIHNFDGVQRSFTITAQCVLQAHLGSEQLVSADFTRNPTTFIAGGVASCPQGKVAIGGGADWNDFNAGHRIDLSSPTPDGRGWSASGWSPEAGSSLHVEAYCIPEGDLGVAAPVVVKNDIASYANNCPAGKRILSGGVMASLPGAVPDPASYFANTLLSYPVSNPSHSWTALTFVPGDQGPVTLWHVAWCIPASQPTIELTITPPAVSSSTTGSFTFSASDPVGENLIIGCAVDAIARACSSQTTLVATGLSPGQHTVDVYATNTSRQQAHDSFTWVVDPVAPTATPPPPGPGIAGPLTVGFSEQVTGVDAASMVVRVKGSATALSGTVSAGSQTASWTPSSPLVPGETYTVSLGSDIEDLAGNSLTPVDYDVRTSTAVASSSPALVQLWDPDANKAASSGKYISSRLSGTSTRWTVTTTAGQKALVYGVRQPTGGYADVYVDGAKKARVSLYSASTQWKQKLFTSAALSSGRHVIEVRVPGRKPKASKGTWVALDYVTVGATRYEEAAATQLFRRVSAGAASGGSYQSVSHVSGGDNGGAPSYQVLFKGTSIQVYGVKSPTSGRAALFVDGTLRASVNLHSTLNKYQALILSASGLADTRHTLKVVCLGSKKGGGSDVGLDHVTVG